MLWNSKRHDLMEKWQMEFSASIKKVKNRYVVEIKVYDGIVMKKEVEKYRDALDTVKEEAKMIRERCKDKNIEFLEYLDRIIRSIEVGEENE